MKYIHGFEKKASELHISVILDFGLYYNPGPGSTHFMVSAIVVVLWFLFHVLQYKCIEECQYYLVSMYLYSSQTRNATAPKYKGNGSKNVLEPIMWFLLS